MSAQEVAERFLGLSAGRLNHADCMAWLTQVNNIEQLQDLSALFALRL
jgi:hypothetical protein